MEFVVDPGRAHALAIAETPIRLAAGLLADGRRPPATTQESDRLLESLFEVELLKPGGMNGPQLAFAAVHRLGKGGRNQIARRVDRGRGVELERRCPV
jgi:hypothetical protein